MSDTKNSVLPDIIEPMSNAIQQNIPETARQAELEVVPEELLQSHDKTQMDEEFCFLWMSKESSFLRWNPLLVKILEDC